MADTLKALAGVLEQRKNADKSTSYVASLYAGAPDSILEKITEEAMEVVEAGKGADNKAIIHEVADLWFHTLVLLASQNLSADDVLIELDRRFGVSGHEEKASRNSDA